MQKFNTLKLMRKWSNAVTKKKASSSFSSMCNKSESDISDDNWPCTKKIAPKFVTFEYSYLTIGTIF